MDLLSRLAGVARFFFETDQGWHSGWQAFFSRNADNRMAEVLVALAFLFLLRVVFGAIRQPSVTASVTTIALGFLGTIIFLLRDPEFVDSLPRIVTAFNSTGPTFLLFVESVMTSISSIIFVLVLPQLLASFTPIVRALHTPNE